MSRKSTVEMEFFQILGHMVQSGCTIREALCAGCETAQEPALGALFSHMLEGLRQGQSLGRIMASQKGVFKPLVLAMMQVADQGASLGEVLGQINTYLRREQELRQKILGALMYPAMVLGSALLALLVIALVVLPAFQDFSLTLGKDAAKQCQGLGDTMSRGLWGLFVGCLTLALGLPWYRAKLSKPGPIKEWHDRTAFAIPLWGSWKRLRTGKDFAFSLEMLTRSGMSLPKALRRVCELATNSLVCRDLEALCRGLAKGQALSVLLGSCSVFPPQAGKWLALGERSGRQSEVFARLGSICDAGLERMCRLVMTLAEPLITLVLGAVVMGFVGIFVLPLLNLYGGM